MSNELKVHDSTGNIFQDMGMRDADERLAKALEKLRDDKPRDVAKELREFRKDLTDLVRKEEVSPAAEQAILEGLLEVERTVDDVLDSDRPGGA
jgi:hypothetical protein